MRPCPLILAITPILTVSRTIYVQCSMVNACTYALQQSSRFAIQWNLHSKDTLGPANIVLNREVSTLQTVVIHRKYRKNVILVTKTCPLYGGFLYCVLNTVSYIGGSTVAQTLK